jgi:acylphosphatase
MLVRQITITGKVHDIGYRYWLMENALAFGIEKFRAVNVEDEKQKVLVYVEGRDEAIEEFCNFVGSNYPSDAIVEDVRIEDYKGYVPKIEAFALVFNIGQSRKFIDYGRDVLKKQDAMLEKQDAMLEKQDAMLEKQDETIKAIREESEKTREEIRALRNDIRAYLDERFKKLEIEIEKIKEAVGLK